MNNVTTILIPIHSFVDLITNSSSETFIAATNKTVDTVKEIVNSLLALSKDTRNFDDLFLIDIVYPVDNDLYNKKTGGPSNEGYSESSLLITVKPGLSEEEEKLAEKIAKLLENFIGTYRIESMSEY